MRLFSQHTGTFSLVAILTVNNCIPNSLPYRNENRTVYRGRKKKRYSLKDTLVPPARSPGMVPSFMLFCRLIYLRTSLLCTPNISSYLFLPTYIHRTTGKKKRTNKQTKKPWSRRDLGNLFGLGIYLPSALSQCIHLPREEQGSEPTLLYSVLWIRYLL